MVALGIQSGSWRLVGASGTTDSRRSVWSRELSCPKGKHDPPPFLLWDRLLQGSQDCKWPLAKTEVTGSQAQGTPGRAKLRYNDHLHNKGSNKSYEPGHRPHYPAGVSSAQSPSDSPVYDQLVVGGRLVTHRAHPCGFLLVHLQVEDRVEALQVCTGLCTAGD